MYSFDEDNVILALNGNRLSDFLGVSIKDETKLTDNLDNKVIKDFITKYKKYFTSNKIEDIKEFYNITGLMLTHVYKINNSECIIYSMNNIFRYNTKKDIYRKAVYITHILVVTNRPDNNEDSYYRKVFWKNEKDLDLIRDINYTISCVSNNKIKVIEEKYNKDAFKNFDKKDIKDVELTLLNNLCVLLKNNDLYLDNKLYAKNVDCIWHQDSYNSYIIYKDNKIEKFSSQFPVSYIYKYKKVAYNNYMLATLKNKRLGITLLVDQVDTSVLTTLYNIDDIYSTKESLYLIIGNKKVRIPSWYNTLVVSNIH